MNDISIGTVFDPIGSHYPHSPTRGSNWGATVLHWNSGQMAGDIGKLCIERY